MVLKTIKKRPTLLIYPLLSIVYIFLVINSQIRTILLMILFLTIAADTFYFWKSKTKKKRGNGEDSKCDFALNIETALCYLAAIAIIIVIILAVYALFTLLVQEPPQYIKLSPFR